MYYYMDTFMDLSNAPKSLRAGLQMVPKGFCIDKAELTRNKEEGLWVMTVLFRKDSDNA